MSFFWVVMLILAFLLLFLMHKRWFGHPDTSRAAQLAAQYQKMTMALLEATPDEKLIEAVVGNLLAKTDDKTCSAYQIIPALSRGRCAVYSVWLLCCELRSGDLDKLYSSADAGFVLLAADGLELFGCDRAAKQLRAYLETRDGALLPALRHILSEDDPFTPMIAYIRACPEDFCDDEM